MSNKTISPSPLQTALSQDLINLASDLIACPSITPKDAGCQQILIDHLSNAGFHCEAMRFDNVDNFWATRGKNAPLVVFAGHTDVVPPGPELEWNSPPFEPEIRNGHLFGRGACDMKGAIAAMVIAAKKFVEDYPEFNGTIGFLITGDEEGPSINGTKKVIEELLKRNIKIDYCIIGEPSSEKKVGDQIRIGRRGSLHGKLTTHGKQGHVAHPHLAKNPIHMTMLALHELSQQQWDRGNAEFPPTTFQITNVHSGTGATNVIPGNLQALFNFRFGTASSTQELKDRAEDILNEHKLSFDIEWNVSGEPFLTQNGKLITKTQEIIQDMLALKVKLSTGGGTSDGRFIAPTGAEVVELGVSHATAHHIDECVLIEDLEILATIYYQLLISLLIAES